MADRYRTNTKVEWEWGNGKGVGHVREVFREKVTRTLQGSEVTREGSDGNPAYLIEQEDGDEILQLHSEISKSS